MKTRKIAAAFCAGLMTISLATSAAASCALQSDENSEKYALGCRDYVCEATERGISCGVTSNGNFDQSAALGSYLNSLLNSLFGSGCGSQQAGSAPNWSAVFPNFNQNQSKPQQPAETENPPIETPSELPPSADEATCSAEAQAVLLLVNEQRAANGLPELTLNAELCAEAQEKAQDMKDNRYFDHESPTYGTPFEMLKAFGITYRAAGENIAMGYKNADAVFGAWMNSAGHRANILNSNYTQMGIGYVENGNYWCQMFIG